MKLAGKTDVGRVRQENQDDYRAGELPGGAVWALVCDGMGGAKGGREASQGACNVIEQVFQEQYAQCGAGQEGAFLKKALISANRYVFNKAAHEESLAGMGTTAVCALVRGGEATLCHAGDSRAYLCRGGKLTQSGVHYPRSHLRHRGRHAQPAGQAGHHIRSDTNHPHHQRIADQRQKRLHHHRHRRAAWSFGTVAPIPP